MNLTNKNIDYMIAEKIMEWNEVSEVKYDEELKLPYMRRYWADRQGNYVNQYHFVPSERMEDAWKVVDKLKLTITPTLKGWKSFTVNVTKSEKDREYIGTSNNQKWIEHKQPEMAICLAALEALGLKI